MSLLKESAPLPLRHCLIIESISRFLIWTFQPVLRAHASVWICNWRRRLELELSVEAVSKSMKETSESCNDASSTMCKLAVWNAHCKRHNSLMITPCLSIALQQRCRHIYYVIRWANVLGKRTEIASKSSWSSSCKLKQIKSCDDHQFKDFKISCKYGHISIAVHSLMNLPILSFLMLVSMVVGRMWLFTGNSSYSHTNAAELNSAATPPSMIVTYGKTIKVSVKESFFLFYF